MDAPTAMLDGCFRSHRVLLRTIEGLTDVQARRASRLPTWSICHLLTHVARNADSVTRRLEGARRCEVIDQYPGGFEGRAADIERGSNRTASDLVSDVRDSAAKLESTADSMDEDAWDRPTRDVNGVLQPAREIMFRRWREVEVHHVDLGMGYSSADWPKELVELWLPRLVEHLAVRADPNLLLAWAIGRGPAPDLGPW